MGKNRFRKILTNATIDGLLLSSVVPYNVLAADSVQNMIQGTSTSSQSKALHLTPKQSKAFNHFNTRSEIKLFPEINVNNSAPVRVIVEFKQSPAEIAVLQEQVAGNDLSLK